MLLLCIFSFRVLSQLPPSVPLFWQKVATYVGSRSPASCQAKAEELKQPKKQGRPHQSTKRPAKEKAKADTKPAGKTIQLLVSIPSVSKIGSTPHQ